MHMTINNKDEMIKLAEQLAKICSKHDVILLNGDLGAGKTFFTKHFAKALGIKEEIVSPTFTLAKEYQNDDVVFYHVDAYRLEGVEEDVSYMFDYYLNGITIIEWPEFISDYLPYSYVQLYIKNTGEESRDITFSFVNKDEFEKKVRAYVL